MFPKKTNYFDLNLKWNKSDDVECPYHTEFNGHKLQVRLNDFPDEKMYSLIIDGDSLCSFDDWPKNWEK